MNLTLSKVQPLHAEEVFAERAAAGKRIYAPEGDTIPFSPAERQLTLLHRWERVVPLFAGRIAVEDGDRTLTYQELNTLANRIAHAILARGVAKGKPVGLLFDIEGEMAAGILAVWKAGNFFTWFEPRQPLARNQFIVEETEATVVVTNRRHAALARQLWPDEGAVIVIEELDEDLPSTNPPITIDASQPAYLIYTSGSTGKPKGTIELHGNLVEMMASREHLYHFRQDDRVAFLLFGVGVMIAFAAALMYGGCLLPFQAKYEGISRFSRWLIDRRITVVVGGADLRTWLLSLDGSLQFPDLRFFSLAAGPTYIEHLHAYQRYLPDHCILANIYSCTEVRHGTVMFLDKKSHFEGRLIPAGYTTAPGAIEIWGEDDRPLPAGEVGEIVVLSPYVAQGYWKSPELTAQKFGVDAQGRRYYRMGDLGRLDEQGCLWVLGRKDSQVKIRGNRVETAEVENAMRELPGVEEAAVIDHGATDEDRVLIGFVSAGAQITGNEVRKLLGAHLPDYMVPIKVVVLDELPRNANGKVDRPALRVLAARERGQANQTELPNMAAVQPTSERVPAEITPVENTNDVVIDGEVCVRGVKIGKQHYHPTGEYLPISRDEVELSALHRWEQMVARYGSNPAVEDNNQVWSYDEANRLMNRIAHAILAYNVPKEKPVALMFDLEAGLPIGIFGIWKAGNFFIWLEPGHPVIRNRYIVEDSDAPLVITNRKHAPVARELWPAEKVIVIEELSDDLPTHNPPVTISGTDPCYLMYTSGSTGKPKGVVELHRNVMAMLFVRQNILHFSSADRLALLVLASGWSFPSLGALLYGGCVFPYQVKEEGLARFSEWLIEKRITIAIGGPVIRSWLLGLDGSQSFPDLRVVSGGAGPMYLEHLQAYQRYLPDNCIFLNTYSATECRSCTVFAMDKSTRVAGRIVPAGYPTWQGTVEIWGDDGKPLPAGEVGEVVAITPFVAQGYWNAPELTASRFGIDAQGRRYYRMGDLGRLDEQGCLWVLGRKDSQVKIRGNRVETAEVEVSLLEIPGVQEAAVIHIGETDETRILIAFVASQAGLSGSELRRQLAARLPAYMVPSTIVVLEELPRNSNGKVARPLLREMAAAFANSRHEAKVEEAPVRSDTEAQVTEMVSELLGSSIGPHDNFFDVGGHFLLAARLMLAVHRTFGVDLAPRDFFAEPTVAALAARIEKALARRAAVAPPVQADRALPIEPVPVVDGAAGHLSIFLCIGRNGAPDLLLHYQELIRHIGTTWSLYGLVANGGDDPNAVYSTMEELVAAAVAAVRRVQPQGPYVLAGECIGSNLAYEMARLLVQQGERVASLILLDAPFRSSGGVGTAVSAGESRFRRSWRGWRNRARYHWRQMAALGWQGGSRYALERLAVLLPAALHPKSSFRPQYLARKRYAKLLTSFEPDKALAQRATAVFSTEYQPNAKKWAALIPGLKVVVVEGQHRGYLRVSGEKIAAVIREELAAVQQKERW